MTPILLDFPPTDEALKARLAAVDVAAYGRTRNRLEGAATRLSPYITHGFLTLPEVAAAIPHRMQDALFGQWAWREFFHHVWAHLGDGILQDIRPALPGVRYQTTLPDDIAQGATGLPVIDRAVRLLYDTGYLHNHARLWLASFVVHYRKVHWRVGADWMFAHLLDGDLASNHLSWQWVAGTFSVKPYLFNAENVAKFAPEAWQVFGSTLDRSYEEMDRVARGDERLEIPGGPAVVAPPCFSMPPDGVGDDGVIPPDCAVRLVHPWALCAREGERVFRLGVIHVPFHTQFPWSARRWQFVMARMRAVCDGIFVGDVRALQRIRENRPSVTAVATHNALYDAALAEVCTQEVQQPARLMPWPPVLCPSFSRFWKEVTQGRDAYFERKPERGGQRQ